MTATIEQLIFTLVHLGATSMHVCDVSAAGQRRAHLVTITMPDAASLADAARQLNATEIRGVSDATHEWLSSELRAATYTVYLSTPHKASRMAV